MRELPKRTARDGKVVGLTKGIETLPECKLMLTLLLLFSRILLTFISGALKCPGASGLINPEATMSTQVVLFRVVAVLTER